MVEQRDNMSLHHVPVGVWPLSEIRHGALYVEFMTFSTDERVKPWIVSWVRVQIRSGLM